MTHPLEEIFDIEEGSTFKNSPVVIKSERAGSLIDPTSGEILPRSIELTPTEVDREERIEEMHIDGQLDSIHTSAMIAYEKSARMAEEVDPKFAARNAEVAAQYLNIALNAVNSRIDAKFKRQKVRLAREGGSKPTTVNNNVIVADRNELLRQILGTNQDSITVDQTTK